MQIFVASVAESDQVLLTILADVTSKLKVMHLEFLHAAAELTTPSVPLKNLPMKSAICKRIEFEAGPLAHDAIPATCLKKACLCGAGRNL